MYKYQSRQTGFTIVELLIVIVVIGILAALTIVAYSGIQQRAVAASLQSDLESASKQLRLYQVDHSSYPTTNDCSAIPAANSICLKGANGTSYAAFQTNNSVNPQTFCLTATNNSISYYVTGDSNPSSGTCSGVIPGGVACPSGFIVVPGSATFGTSDFCVMKYEAKQASGTVPISQASGLPWVSISQSNAISYSQNVAGCTGCHLITEAEWLTIAQNVASVASNWSGGAVGSGYIYNGHVNNSPASPLDASTNDSDNLYGITGGTGSSSAYNTPRTLTLSNGEVIWDFSGNVYELTQGTIAAGAQPGPSGESAYTWKQWNGGFTQYGLLSITYPVYAIASASGWSSTQGIGQLYSDHGDTLIRAYIRGGAWSGGVNVGIYALNMHYATSDTNTNFGFRVAR